MREARDTPEHRNIKTVHVLAEPSKFVTRTMMRRAGARTGACMKFGVTGIRSGYTRGYIRDVPLRGFCAALPSYTGRDDDIWFGR